MNDRAVLLCFSFWERQFKQKSFFENTREKTRKNEILKAFQILPESQRIFLTKNAKKLLTFKRFCSILCFINIGWLLMPFLLILKSIVSGMPRVFPVGKGVYKWKIM